MTPWAEVHNAFEPFSPIPPEKLESWFVERPDSPLGVLLADLDPRKLPRRTILVGHPASGKSTELAVLAAELAKEPYGYLVVRINLEQNLFIDKVNPVEVVFLMGAAIYKVAQAELGEALPGEHLEELAHGLETIVRTHTANSKYSLNLADVLSGMVVYGAGLIAGPVAAAAVGSMTQRMIAPFTFVSGTDESVARKLEVEPQVERMVDRLNQLIADVEDRAGRPLVLIVDGLDKIPNPDLIALHFVEKRFLADPACRVIFTAPMEVYYASRFAGARSRFPVRPFPNVKLRPRDVPSRPVPEGHAVMREVVRRRIESLGLGLDDVIEPAALDMLVGASGGVMRDVVTLMQEAATLAEIAHASAIGSGAAALAVNQRRQLYAVQLRPQYLRVLEQVRKTRARTDDPECDELLRANLVLSFVNDDVWFDAHAILDPILGAALEARPPERPSP